MPTDLTDPGALRALTDALDARGIVLSALANNAAEPMRGRLRDYAESEIVAKLRLMVDAPVHLCRYFLRGLQEHEPIAQSKVRPHVLNVASLGALLPTPKMGVYGPAKAFLVHMSETLAAEHEPNVRVICLCPGYVRTGVHARTGVGHLEHSVPAWMWSEPAEVARYALDQLEVDGAVVRIPGLVNRLASWFFALGPTQRMWRRMVADRPLRATLSAAGQQRDEKAAAPPPALHGPTADPGGLHPLKLAAATASPLPPVALRSRSRL